MKDQIKEIKKHSTKLFILVAVVIIVTAGLALLQQSQATIELTVLDNNARVFVDQERHEFVESAGKTISIQLPEGEHSVLVASNNSWPWQKEISLEAGETYPITAFLLSKQPRGEIVKKSDKQYEQINTLIEETKLPTKDSPRLSPDENISLWTDGKTIKAKWRGSSENYPPSFCLTRACTDEITIHQSSSKIRALDFYPRQQNIILYAAQNGVFAIDMNKSPTQNVQPVYTGDAPTFALPKKQSGQRVGIFVKDTDGTVMQLAL